METTKLKKFLGSPIFSGLLLVAMAVIAFIWANVDYTSYDTFWNSPREIVVGHDYFIFKMQSLSIFVNDVLMVIFFFGVGLEIKREIVAGHLSSFKKAMLPVGAAIGGMVFPALIYVFFNFSSPDTSHGWGIPMATDIAFSLAIISLLGKRVPISLKVFLTALAIADDMGGIAVIAIFYTDHLDVMQLLLALGGAVLLLIANLVKIRATFFYYLFGVILIWIPMVNSGVHATIAGILTALAFPTGIRRKPSDFKMVAQQLVDNLRRYQDTDVNKGVASDELSHIYSKLARDTMKAQSPLQRVEHMLMPIINYFIVPVFALANAGVYIGGQEGIWGMLTTPVALGVGLGLLIGKPLGIFFFTFLFVKLGLGDMPARVRWIQIFGMGIIAAMGFTVALFITNLSFRGPQATAFVADAKIAILIVSLLAAVAGYIFLFVCHKMENHK